MRGWGIAVLGTVVGGVVLPEPLQWWPLVIVAVAGAFALATTYAEHRERVKAAQAKDTKGALAYYARIREMDAEVEAEWALILGAVNGTRPLAATTPPPRLRSISPRIPLQRTTSV